MAHLFAELLKLNLLESSYLIATRTGLAGALTEEHEIWGWAWADGGVRKVYVRTDDAEVWRPAEVEPWHGHRH